MTSKIVHALVILTGSFGQQEDVSAREMLIAATDAERALTHGEIVFRYIPDDDDRIDLEVALERPVDADELKILYTFRDRQHFRISIQANGATLRTIVSDGEFIDTGNGELWDYRYWGEDFGSANQKLDDEFFDRFWLFSYTIDRHLFPLTTSFESEYFDTEDVSIEFEADEDTAASTRVIRFEWLPYDKDDYETWDRFEITTDPAYRMASWISYYEGESYGVEEWSQITPVADGRTVMGVYRHSYPEDESESVSTTTIDFTASKFDHTPHESEFVIDRSGIDRVVKWSAPNPFADEIEFLLWDVFGVEVDLESAFRKAVWTTLTVMGVFAALLVAFEVRRRRRKNRQPRDS